MRGFRFSVLRCLDLGFRVEGVRDFRFSVLGCLGLGLRGFRLIGLRVFGFRVHGITVQGPVAWGTLQRSSRGFGVKAGTLLF